MFMCINTVHTQNIHNTHNTHNTYSVMEWMRVRFDSPSKLVILLIDKFYSELDSGHNVTHQPTTS